MPTDSRISEAVSEFFSNISDRITEQAWFQELKGKWDELDPQSRLYLQIAGAIATVLVVLGGAGSFVWSVHSLKRELTEKSELLSQLQSANDELRRLRETTSSLGASTAGGNDPWQPYFATVAGSSGVPKESVTVSDEKKGTGSDQVKESLFEINLKHVNLRQVVRFAFSLDSGMRPVKTRNLLVDTQGDPAGYMDATFSVSAFTLLNK